jgi:hypothetical protein
VEEHNRRRSSPVDEGTEGACDFLTDNDDVRVRVFGPWYFPLETLITALEVPNLASQLLGIGLGFSLGAGGAWCPCSVADLCGRVCELERVSCTANCTLSAGKPSPANR